MTKQIQVKDETHRKILEISEATDRTIVDLVKLGIDNMHKEVFIRVKKCRCGTGKDIGPHHVIDCENYLPF